MGLIDRIRRRPHAPDDDFSPMPGFRVVHGDDTRFLHDGEALALMRAGAAQRTAQEQYYVLDALADEGRAEVLPDGFAMSTEAVARLDDVDAAVLGLPARFAGQVHASVYRWTTSPDFRIDLLLQVGAHPAPPVRRGPLIQVGGQRFRASVPLLRTLRVLEAHEALPRSARTETENVRLVAQLKAAQKVASSADPELADSAFSYSLGALDGFDAVTPPAVGITVAPQPDGSLLVEPDLGPGIDRDKVADRWHQVAPGRHLEEGAHDEPGRSAVMRVDSTLVLLEPEQVAGVREVQRRPRIPAEEVAQFLRAPGSYFDPTLVDVDIRFSVRVAGLGIIAPITFDEAATSGIDWFAAQTTVSPPERLAQMATSSAEQMQVQEAVTRAHERGEQVAPVREELVDVSDRSRVAEALEASRRRVEALELDRVAAAPAPEPRGQQVTVGMHLHDAVDLSDLLRDRAADAVPLHPVDYASLCRVPFPHQRVGIEWMTGLMQRALTGPEGDPGALQGALLADDMGLGKTFMTLAALAEGRRAWDGTGRAPLPDLAVMPVALLENWLAEIEQTFGTRHGPFADVVVLQGAALADYRPHGAPAETAASVDDLDEQGMVREDRLHASLRVGPAFGDARLDRPGVLVLTTYETLRRYQVSLGSVHWGVVVLDEAQATKNPEILASRAAKALHARFKLLATGTPVENSLRDFWSLVDTAQPGLLGSWKDFQETWVVPISTASGAEHERLGRALRDAVGSFMLRRVKEDHLTDLPAKVVHEYPHPMPAAQVAAYDAVLDDHRRRGGTRGAALKTLQQLAAVSLHPGLVAGGLPPDVVGIDQSARTFVTVRVVLDEVRARGEKAIVFAKTKEVQRALARWLHDIYGLAVDIVNGDTAATGPGQTRITKIRAFEARPGFGVIIMSPLAVGVGLTVVGANHAIHLERHWNPAKEAQATDRVHRIGQTREVHVHYPVALHPDVDSFDLNLDRLLRSKVALKNAVVVPQEVSPGELESALGLRPSRPGGDPTA